MVKSGNLAYATHEFQFTEKAQDEEERIDVQMDGADDEERDADGEPEVVEPMVEVPATRLRKKATRAKKSAETVESEPDAPRVAVST